jgi:hypothetical protein
LRKRQTKWEAWEAAQVRADALYPILDDDLDEAQIRAIDAKLEARYPALVADYNENALGTAPEWDMLEHLATGTLTIEQIKAKIPPPRLSKRDLENLRACRAICVEILEKKDPDLAEIERGYIRTCYSHISYLLEAARY